MIEISSPDAMSIQRIKIDGVKRWSIQPVAVRNLNAIARHGTMIEWASQPASGCGVRYFTRQADALAHAVDHAIRY